MRSLCVGVTGVHIASAPKSGSVVLKELARWPGLRPVGLIDYPQSCALSWANLLHHAFLIPQSLEDRTRFLDRILDVHRRIGFSLLIPSADEDVEALSSELSTLHQNDLPVLIPKVGVVKAVRKQNLSMSLSSIGLSTPDQVCILKPSEVEEKELQFPVVVKGCLARAHLARNAEEAQGFARQLISTWGAPVILQEWVQGEEYSAAIFADRQSILKAACVIRKMGMSDQGKTWMAVTVEANPFLRLVDSFVRKLGWTGPAEVEIIKRENGELVVFEVNPRFPAWLPLCRHAGADMVDTALRIAMGKEEREMKIGKAGSCFARNYHSSVFSMQDMGSFYSQGELEFRSSR